MRIAAVIVALMFLGKPAEAEIFGDILGGFDSEIRQGIEKIINEAEKSDNLEATHKPLSGEVNRIGSIEELCAKFPTYPGCLGSGTPNDPLIDGIEP